MSIHCIPQNAFARLPLSPGNAQGYPVARPRGGPHAGTDPFHRRQARPGTSGRFADVFNPATGEVQAKVPLASKAELDAAVASAAEAQPKWGATNPQRRARVMMEFVRLLNRDMDKLAEALSREHGKTIPDAKGDVQRGLEVVEFCIGAPHLLKGEFTDSAGPGIDMYSMRQALGVVAGITPFNFPAMIPMWKFAPAIACGNAFILKPSERDPSVPLMLAELMMEAGLPDGHPPGRERRQGGGGRHPRQRHDPGRSASWARPPSPSTSTPAAARTANASSASAAPRTT
jgi:hypothetical protein